MSWNSDYAIESLENELELYKKALELACSHSLVTFINDTGNFEYTKAVKPEYWLNQAIDELLRTVHTEFDV